MRHRRTTGILATVTLAAIAGGTAACGGSGSGSGSRSTATAASASTPRAAASTEAPAPAQQADPNGQQCPALDAGGYCPGYDPMSCTTVVDPAGYRNGPLDVNRAVAFLTVMLTEDGLVNIPAGTPSADDAQILDSMASVLTGPTPGSQLSTDAAQFSADELAYNPDNAASVNLAEAHPLISDIEALQHDCPAGLKEGAQMIAGTG